MTTKPVRFTKFTAYVLPSCFSDTDEYESWRVLARRNPPGDNWVCTDCTTRYQAKMSAAGRCAYPERDIAKLEMQDALV